ncbi:MAG: DNA polymerase III subunit delta [Actinomycetes bacterium]
MAGSEDLLADRAVERVRSALRDAHADLEVLHVDAATYEAGQLAVSTSPSLFGETRLVVASGVEVCTDPFVADATRYLGELQEGVTLVLRHRGGQRGKKLMDAVKALENAVVVECPEVKGDAAKAEFVGQEFREAGRKITQSGVRALVDAVGSDLRALATACAQLVADTAGDVTVAEVDRYYGGRVETTGFKVADAVAARNGSEALALVRQAVDTGVDPVPLVAAIAAKLRTMAKVAGTGGRGVDVARQLGLPPWQVDRARRELRGWSPRGIATALIALAEADEAVKGGSRDAVYAVEKAVMTITAARG